MKRTLKTLKRQCKITPINSLFHKNSKILQSQETYVLWFLKGNNQKIILSMSQPYTKASCTAYGAHAFLSANWR
jgi:hypothetical protein